VPSPIEQRCPWRVQGGARGQGIEGILKRRRIMLSRMIWSASSEGAYGADKVFRKQTLDPWNPRTLFPNLNTSLLDNKILLD